jgi:hypothetical protein
VTNAATIFAGSKITAAGQAGIAPMCAAKGSNQSLASSVSLQNDNAVLLAVAANTTYKWLCTLFYTGGTEGSSDLQFNWTGPSGAAWTFTADYRNTSGVFVGGVGFTQASANIVCGSNGSSFLCAVKMSGILIVGSTAGTFQLQWAQDTSNSTATVMQANSDLTMWNVS